VQGRREMEAVIGGSHSDLRDGKVVEGDVHVGYVEEDGHPIEPAEDHILAAGAEHERFVVGYAALKVIVSEIWMQSPSSADSINACIWATSLAVPMAPLSHEGNPVLVAAASLVHHDASSASSPAKRTRGIVLVGLSACSQCGPGPSPVTLARCVTAGLLAIALGQLSVSWRGQGTCTVFKFTPAATLHQTRDQKHEVKVCHPI
jgi:hypothetical protein